MAGNLLSLLVLLVDRIWIGHVSTDALAALGVAHAALMVCTTAIMGPAIGTLAGVANHVGSGDTERAGQYLGQGLIVGVLVGVAFALLALVLPDLVMSMMNADPTVTEPAKDYLAISMVGLAFNGPLFVLTFGIQGAGEAKTSLLIQAIAPVVNGVLDPIFIFGLGLGLSGAAYASVIGYALGALVAVVIVVRGRHLRVSLRSEYLRWHRNVADRVIAVGLPGTFEQLVRTVALLLMVKILSQFDAVILSSYTAIIMITMLTVFPGLALGQATAALMGQNLGARQPERAWRTAWLSVRIYLGMMICAGLTLGYFAHGIVGIFDPNPVVIQEGATFLRIMVLSYPGVAVALILSKAFSGASETRLPMIAAAIAHLVFQIPCAWHWSQTYGAIGAYWAIVAAFYAHAVLNATLFWMKYRPRDSAHEPAEC